MSYSFQIGITSVAYAQSEILQKEVYLFEQIDKSGQGPTMKHMKCVVFLRPTQENIQLLSAELKSPRYGVYYICKPILKHKFIVLKVMGSIVFQLILVDFSGIISKAAIKVLAESDESEVVREIQEFYADFFAISPHLFTLNLEKPITGNSDSVKIHS